jgi:hypothetical protein
VVLEVEHGERGANPRFLVTTLTELPPGLVYDRAYCPRGQSESFIKDLKIALAADRLSCHRFVANAFLPDAARGRVSADACVAQCLRARCAGAGPAPDGHAAAAPAQGRRILVRLPRAFPLAAAFGAIARQLCAT